MKKYQCYIGIDPGTHTGFAVVSDGILRRVESMGIIEAMDAIMYLVSAFEKENILVRYEDATQRTWFGNAGKERLKGAGSVERDCRVWNEFLTLRGIPFEAVHPKNNKTKLTAEQFKRLTGWEKQSNEHGRDAACLVFGL